MVHATLRFIQIFATSCFEADARRLQILVDCDGAHRFRPMRHCASLALFALASLGGVSRLHPPQALLRTWLSAVRAGPRVGLARHLPYTAPHLLYVRHHPDAEGGPNAP